MFDRFKNSVIENKQLLEIEKKQRINIMALRNKFLGEWASSILGLNQNQKKLYIRNVIKLDLENIYSKVIINKIVKDFKKKQINISSKEVKFKTNDF